MTVLHTASKYNVCVFVCLQQILGQMVIKCLKEVTKHNYTSIAFPPLGSGNLGYPLDVVADTMIGAIEQFEKETHGFSVREVKIIVYNSPDTVKVGVKGHKYCHESLGTLKIQIILMT